LIAFVAKGIDALSSMPRRRWWTVLLAVSLTARLAWSVAMRDRTPQFDEVEYTRHAVDVFEGRGYVDRDGRVTAYHPVGYPVALAGAYRVFGPGKVSGVLFQTGVGVATCVVLALVAASALGPVAGRAAGLMLAIYPNHVFYSTLHLTEPLSTFLLILAVLFLLRPSSLFSVAAAGVLLGLAALVRPVFILLPAVLAFWYWRVYPTRRGAMVRTGITGILALAAVSPWLIRNHSVTGRWTTVSTTGGHNFWVGNYRGAFGGYKHDRAINDSLLVGGQRDYDRGYRLGLEAIKQAPLRAAARVLSKLTYFVALETDGALWNLKGLPEKPPTWLTILLLAAANLSYVAVVSLATLGVLRSPPRDPLATLFLLITGYLMVMAAIFTADPRHHFPLIPFACAFAIAGLPLTVANGVRRPLSSGWKTAWGLLTALFAVMLIANLAIKYFEVRTLG
jgi:4-amino-4-deoxy-L-arabinose transferase-like glycosyltransferase